jgi:RNA polymerase sigma factor (sigma-70 family)
MVPRRDEPGLTFEQIYVPLFPVLYRVAYRIVGSAEQAEDVCHEAFLKYVQRTRPLPDLVQTKYWLIRVVRNLSLNVEKRRGRESRAYGRAARLGATHTAGVEDVVIREEERSDVVRALANLPISLRTALVLKEYAGLNYREIGSIMNISEGNVKVRVFRARERLAKELQPEEPGGNAPKAGGGETDVS